MTNERIYTVFTRTWWKANPEWPDGREPQMGRKKILRRNLTMDEARQMCKEWNDSRPKGKYSRRAEFAAL